MGMRAYSTPILAALPGERDLRAPASPVYRVRGRQRLVGEVVKLGEGHPWAPRFAPATPGEAAMRSSGAGSCQSRRVRSRPNEASEALRFGKHSGEIVDIDGAEFIECEFRGTRFDTAAERCHESSSAHSLTFALLRRRSRREDGGVPQSEGVTAQWPAKGSARHFCRSVCQLTRTSHTLDSLARHDGSSIV
jgi:hypothetical protein